jgi:hypothetical protein
MRKAILLAALLTLDAAAQAQLPGLRRRAPVPAQPVLQGIDIPRSSSGSKAMAIPAIRAIMRWRLVLGGPRKRDPTWC